MDECVAAGQSKLTCTTKCRYACVYWRNDHCEHYVISMPTVLQNIIWQTNVAVSAASDYNCAACYCVQCAQDIKFLSPETGRRKSREIILKAWTLLRISMITKWDMRRFIPVHFVSFLQCLLKYLISIFCIWFNNAVINSGIKHNNKAT